MLDVINALLIRIVGWKLGEHKLSLPLQQLISQYSVLVSYFLLTIPIANCQMPVTKFTTQ
jgi:hypothetical protein